MIYFLLSLDFYWIFRAHTPQLSVSLSGQLQMKTIQLGEFLNLGELVSFDIGMLTEGSQYT